MLRWFFKYIIMTTLQYKLLERVVYIIIYEVKKGMQTSRIFTWWGVPNVNIKHVPLPILYCSTVMEALHNAEINSLLCL